MKSTKNNKTIGVVGGVGPYAGIDLVKKIFDNTKANCDQEHLPVALLSFPENIDDRTSFLMEETKTNPAHEVVRIICRLEVIGVSVIGIPCNTFHSPKIYDVVVDELFKCGSKVKILHMIEEVAMYMLNEYPEIKNVGLLSTIGTYNSKIYSNILESKGINVIVPGEKIRKDWVHDAIYNIDHGIKSKSNPVTNIAKKKLVSAVKHLQDRGAEAIVLGCTELPLAFDDLDNSSLIFVDPTNILARALIRETSPDKLK